MPLQHVAAHLCELVELLLIEAALLKQAAEPRRRARLGASWLVARARRNGGGGSQTPENSQEPHDERGAAAVALSFRAGSG